jgi:hypothetical protein
MELNVFDIITVLRPRLNYLYLFFNNPIKKFALGSEFYNKIYFLIKRCLKEILDF